MHGVNLSVGVAELNYESYKAFSDTILMQRSDDLVDEQNRMDNFLMSGKKLGVDDFHWPNTQIHFGRFRNYEYLKIGCGFELSLKSKLLNLGYIVHEIDKANSKYATLAKEQKKRPVAIEELMNISDFMYDGTHNVLPGITINSLSFSRIIGERNYKNAYSFTNEIIEIIVDYKDLRNAIHLPGDQIETRKLKSMSWSDKISFINRYIFDHIITVNRLMVKNHGLHTSLNIDEYDQSL